MTHGGTASACRYEHPLSRYRDKTCISVLPPRACKQGSELRRDPSSETVCRYLHLLPILVPSLGARNLLGSSSFRSRRLLLLPLLLPPRPSPSSPAAPFIPSLPTPPELPLPPRDLFTDSSEKVVLQARPRTPRDHTLHVHVQAPGIPRPYRGRPLARGQETKDMDEEKNLLGRPRTSVRPRT